MIAWLKQKLASAIDAASGRTTLFAIAFFFTGNVFHYFHRLDANYIAFMSALLTLVLGHSVKEDYFAKDGAQRP